MNRKRLSLTLRLTDYEHLKKLAREYEYTMSGFVTEVLTLLFNYSRNTKKVKLPTIKEEITQMFSELIDYEQTPANTLPMVRHLNRDPDHARQVCTHDNTAPDESLTNIEHLEDATSVYTQSIDELLKSDRDKAKVYDDSDEAI